MSTFGTLLVLLIVSAVLIVVLIGVIIERVNHQKQEELRRKRETAQRRSATVVSIEHKIDWADTLVSRRSFRSYDLSSYYLMVEWTNPETQQLVTSPTRLIPGHCRYHPGEQVFVYVHPTTREVWLDTPYQPPDRSRVGGFLP